MRIAVVLVLAAGMLPAALAADIEIPPEHVEAVARAQRLGVALSQAVPAAKAASRALKKRAERQGADLCAFDYKDVAIRDGDALLSYLIATSGRRTDLVVGRHFLLSASGAVPSTRTCLDMSPPRGKPDQQPAYVMVTHLLSPSPNEFHVYLSLAQPVPLVVLTETGTWIVERGRIGLESRREAAAGSNAPVDRPQGLLKEQMAAFEAAIAPHVARARETWPPVRARYLAGMPSTEVLYVTTQLRDAEGRMEQVFIRVSRIDTAGITGRIASELRNVTGFQRGQDHTIPESQLVDWTVVRPDGSEEGNVVGKFLDTYRP